LLAPLAVVANYPETSSDRDGFLHLLVCVKAWWSAHHTRHVFFKRAGCSVGFKLAFPWFPFVF
jgi:hypothetical protein